MIGQTDLPQEVKDALVVAASTAIGAVAGGHAGAASAFNAASNNYLTSKQVRDMMDALAKAPNQQQRRCHSSELC